MPAVMVDAKKVRDGIARKCAEMDAVMTQIAEAKEADDKEKLADAQENLKTLETDLDEYKTQLEAVKAKKRRDDLLNEAKSAAAPAPIDTAPVGRNIDIPHASAQAKDHVVEERVKREVFFNYMRGDDPVGQKRDLITPKSATLQNAAGKNTPMVVIPKSLVASMVGPRVARAMGYPVGKAILATENSVTNSSRGDYLLRDEYIAQMQQLPYPEPVWLPYVSIIPTTHGTSTVFPSLAQTDASNGTGEFGGVSFTWINEAAEKTEKEPTFDQITITAYEVAAYTEVSSRALNRSEIALEAYLRSLFAAAFEYELDRVIFNGSGVGQPLGIINASGVRSVARQTAGSVNYVDTVNLKHALYSHHRNGARYAMHDDVDEILEETIDSEGRPIYKASTAAGTYDRINGYPFDVSYNCAALGTTGDVVFGNPAWYTLTLEEEFGIARSEHYKFQNDLVAYRMYAVVGGRPMLPRGFAILSDAAS